MQCSCSLQVDCHLSVTEVHSLCRHTRSKVKPLLDSKEFQNAIEHGIMERKRTLCSTVHAMVAWCRSLSPTMICLFFLLVPPSFPFTAVLLSARAKISVSLSEKRNPTWDVSMLSHMFALGHTYSLQFCPLS